MERTVTRMQKKRLSPIILAPLVIFLLAVGCARTQPELSLQTASFTFGTVENGDIVAKTLLVYNQGRAPLVVQEISTSCSCTTATVDPMTIQPGESGELYIEFDSGAHGPELEGSVKRQIFITSNDPRQQEEVVEFTAEITAPSSKD